MPRISRALQRRQQIALARQHLKDVKQVERLQRQEPEPWTVARLLQSDTPRAFRASLVKVGFVMSICIALSAVISLLTRPRERKAWNEPLPYWTMALSSTTADTRDSSLGAIEYFQPHSRKIVASVAHLLDDASVDVREHAVSALITLGQASRDNASAVRTQASAVFNTSKGRDARIGAVLVLRSLGHDTAAASLLTQSTSDSDDHVRAAAVDALGQVAAADDGAAATVLLGRLNDPSAQVRTATLASFRALRPTDQILLHVAGSALADSAASVREEAAYAVADFGPGAQQYRQQLLVAARDSDRGVRAAALRALSQIDARHTPQ